MNLDLNLAEKLCCPRFNLSKSSVHFGFLFLGGGGFLFFF